MSNLAKKFQARPQKGASSTSSTPPNKRPGRVRRISAALSLRKPGVKRWSMPYSQYRFSELDEETGALNIHYNSCSFIVRGSRLDQLLDSLDSLSLATIEESSSEYDDVANDAPYIEEITFKERSTA